MNAVTFPPIMKRDAWAEHLDDVLRSLDVPPGVMADNIAASVAAYCREFMPHGVRRSDLILLIARSFSAVNDRAAARRALCSLKSHERHAERWLEILSELQHFPSLLPYFSLGAIRPADWVGAQVDRMWILDFDRVSLSAAEKHEMMIHGSIRALVEHMVVFWDATAGEGVLGVKGLSTLYVEEGTRSRQTVTAADDLLQYITDLLLQQKEPRGWDAVPTLLNLDL